VPELLEAGHHFSFSPLTAAQQLRPVPAPRRQAPSRRRPASRPPVASPVSTAAAAAFRQGSTDRQELLCSVIGLSVKLGMTLLAGLSLVHLAGAYQQRLSQHDELSAILQIEQAKLQKAQKRFDQLFVTSGEQHLIREQDQWIAPDRLRVVWNDPTDSEPSPASTARPLISTKPLPAQLPR